MYSELSLTKPRKVPIAKTVRLGFCAVSAGKLIARCLRFYIRNCAVFAISPLFWISTAKWSIGQSFFDILRILYSLVSSPVVNRYRPVFSRFDGVRTFPDCENKNSQLGTSWLCFSPFPSWFFKDLTGSPVGSPAGRCVKSITLRFPHASQTICMVVDEETLRGIN